MIDCTILFFVNRISVGFYFNFSTLVFAIIDLIIVPEHGWLCFSRRENWYLNNWGKRIFSIR